LNQAQEREKSHDQDYRCFVFCLGYLVIGAGNASLADSVREHDHAGRCRLRGGADNG
jgi:hypothetical protein